MNEITMENGIITMYFTGERYVPEIHGNIELEHLHRYFFVYDLAKGKEVLDIASGEGYGSAMLADVATRVIGVDNSIEAIKHSSIRYKKENLEFRLGSCSEISLPDSSVDLVISFETIEHHDQHDKMMIEIRRVLRPNGILVISSPDKYNYSKYTGYVNEYHVKELYEHEFEHLLGKYFINSAFYGQRIVYGSGIFSRESTMRITNYFNGSNAVQASRGIIKPTYWVAIASDFELPLINSGIFEQPINETELVKFWQNEVVKRDDNIFNLNKLVEKSGLKTNRLNQIIMERDKQIIKLQEKIADLESQLDGIRSSSSWKLTRPLRALVIWARKMFLGVYSKSRKIYCSLWFKSTPTISSLAAPIATVNLPAANGIWEWSEYNETKQHINQIKSQKLQRFEAVPLDLIDSNKETIETIIAEIKLASNVKQPVVSIILPVYNNLPLTLECLLSISLNTNSLISYEVIVADDASTDNTCSVLSQIPNIRLVTNEINLGFLRNCNKAIDYVNGKYVLFLNNDVQVTKGWLDALLETFNTQLKVGAVGPRFVYPSGHLQEAGVSFRADATADMVGLNDDPSLPCYNYIRRVDYVSGACLLMPTVLVKQLGGFSEDYIPCYCEDSDLCLRVQEAGFYVYYNPSSTIIHHLSKTTDSIDSGLKLQSITRNLVSLREKWHHKLDELVVPKIIAFYLPQFYPFPENNKWWGSGFTEWANVTKAQPNFIGHYQPRLPADLGFYDLRVNQVMEQQSELAERYGIYGFCYYYYWFDGKRLLDYPVEQMLSTGKPKIPFCLCWANENWTRRWDGQESEILIAQGHSEKDDILVITDLIRFFEDERYIKIDGRPLIIIYRVTLFPNFAETAQRWRKECRDRGLGEIYIAMVESFELVNSNRKPSEFGCDAAVEFPPHGLADKGQASGEIINSDFIGDIADYRELASKCATREGPAYTRFRGVIPGWDNTARRQNGSFLFEHSTPGTFQAWLEESIEQTRRMNYRDEKLVFINAWNEWAEGAYLEPDRRFGHTYLEAVKNALEATRLLKRSKYGLEN